MSALFYSDPSHWQWAWHAAGPYAPVYWRAGSINARPLYSWRQLKASSPCCNTTAKLRLSALSLSNLTFISGNLELAYPVFQALHTLVLGATGAAEDFTVGFDAVADYPAIAMRANRRHGVDCTFETVKCHCLSALCNLKGLIVIVAADITLGHQKLHHQSYRNTTAKVAPSSLVLAALGGYNRGRPDGRWCRMAV